MFFAYIFYIFFLRGFFLGSLAFLTGATMATVDTDCFFLKRWWPGRPIIEVLILDLSSRTVLFFLLFLDFDLDLSALFSLNSLTATFLKSLTSLIFYLPSFSRLFCRCRLLTEGRLFFIEFFFFVLDSNFIRSSIALLQERLYLRRSSPNLARIDSSILLLFLLSFLVRELRLNSESLSFFLLLESRLNFLRLG